MLAPKQADRGGLANSFEARSDIDAVAHQVAIALFDHVAEMNTDAKLDALLGRHADVTLDHAGLHLDGATHRVDHAPELDDRAVAGALDDAAVVERNGRVNEVAAERPEAREGALLVSAGEAAVADNIRDQDRDELSALAHYTASGDATLP